MLACICGGCLEAMLVAVGLGWIIAGIKKLVDRWHKRRGCPCGCHKEEKKG